VGVWDKALSFNLPREMVNIWSYPQVSIHGPLASHREGEECRRKLFIIMRERAREWQKRRRERGEPWSL
jgi:hypothetical protein